jgi:NAD(P)-dependent dehydrogenase (short-subunit alcohol dehydrogenase family)
MLNSFAAGSCALVQGGSRGLGLALVESLAASESFSTVIACSRQPRASSELQALVDDSQGRVRMLELDVTRPESIVAAAGEVRRMGVRLDLVINVAGLLHDEPGLMPEKRLEDLDLEVMQRVFLVNALGPAVFMRHFLPLMPADRRAVLALVSARVGSIGDNRLGGWYAYRASKAALNQLMKTASIEARRRFGNIILTALHPGTTDTALSRPFQSNVPEDKLFTPAFAAERLLEVIDSLSESDSGCFRAWDGQDIPW